VATELTAVVTNMRFSQATGEECAKPGTGDFLRTFLVMSHRSGIPFSEEIPNPPGPLQAGQFSA